MIMHTLTVHVPDTSARRSVLFNEFRLVTHYNRFRLLSFNLL